MQHWMLYLCIYLVCTVAYLRSCCSCIAQLLQHICHMGALPRIILPGLVVHVAAAMPLCVLAQRPSLLYWSL